MARVLIGFMGSGKSTIAGLLDADYVDMDAYIEDKLGMTIAAYFAKEGEAAFRQIEEQVLQELLAGNRLISTGGGVVMSAANRALLTQADQVIYLDADFETLYRRLSQDQVNQRPLFAQKSKKELEALFDLRQPLYQACASQTVSVVGKTPQEIVEEIR